MPQSHYGLPEKHQFFLKAVILNEVRNLIFSKILDLQVSPFGRNDTKLFSKQTIYGLIDYITKLPLLPNYLYHQLPLLPNYPIITSA